MSPAEVGSVRIEATIEEGQIQVRFLSGVMLGQIQVLHYFSCSHAETKACTSMVIVHPCIYGGQA